MGRRTGANAIDWDLIEREYRLGLKSNKQLAAEFGVHAASIGRRADKYGWVVDKRGEVDATVGSLLIQAASGVCNPNATPNAIQIKAAAQATADVVLAHRGSLDRLAAQRDRLLQEQELMTEHTDAMLEAVSDLDDGSAVEQRQARLVQAVLSHPDRVESLKKLTEIDERIRRGQREAFGLDDRREERESSHAATLRKALEA